VQAHPTTGSGGLKQVRVQAHTSSTGRGGLSAGVSVKWVQRGAHSANPKQIIRSFTPERAPRVPEPAAAAGLQHAVLKAGSVMGPEPEFEPEPEPEPALMVDVSYTLCVRYGTYMQGLPCKERVPIPTPPSLQGVPIVYRMYLAGRGVYMQRQHLSCWRQQLVQGMPPHARVGLTGMGGCRCLIAQRIPQEPALRASRSRREQPTAPRSPAWTER